MRVRVLCVYVCARVCTCVRVYGACVYGCVWCMGVYGVCMVCIGVCMVCVWLCMVCVYSMCMYGVCMV